MIIYEVAADGDDSPEYFTSKAAAIKGAKFYGKDEDGAWNCKVFLVEIDKPTKEVVCRLLARKGYANRQEQVWPDPTVYRS